MIKNIFTVGSDIIDYVINLRIIDIPLHIAYIGVMIAFGYCVAMVIVGVPCSIWEAITKKKIQDEGQDRVIRLVTICLDIVLVIWLFYDLATKS